jgi:hypothetical protein
MSEAQPTRTAALDLTAPEPAPLKSTKSGIGLWDRNNAGTAVAHAAQAGFGWYYNWGHDPIRGARPVADAPSFVAMIWDEKTATTKGLARAKASGATTLLGFNEPDDKRQAVMTVEQALALWPKLEATGLRLGSPAPTQHGVLGPNSWLARFMDGAERKGMRVDFIAVHYYSKDKDVRAFKAFLEAVHRQYGKPVWVTEWALADWDDPSRFSVAEQSAFARAGTEMMEALPFVERHAWFAAYDGGDGWHLNSGILDDAGRLTRVGVTFAALNGLGDGRPATVMASARRDGRAARRSGSGS